MPRLDAIGIVVSSMATSTEFYRHLGLDFPDGAENEGHVEAKTPGGIRVMLDTEDMLKSFSDWEHPHGGGQRTTLPFCARHLPRLTASIFSSPKLAGAA